MNRLELLQSEHNTLKEDYNKILKALNLSISQNNIIKMLHEKMVDDYADYKLESLKMDNKLKDEIKKYKQLYEGVCEIIG